MGLRNYYFMLNDLKNAEFASICNQLSGGICLISKDGTEQILFVSSGLLEMYGCKSEQEFLSRCGGTLQGIMEEQDYMPLHVLTKTDTKPIIPAFSYKDTAGRLRHTEGPIRSVHVNGYGDVYLLQAFRSDVLRKNINHDLIPGLPGMHEFYRRAMDLAHIKLADGTFTEFCPVYFNVSNFKSYNRKYGMPAGDSLLRKIAEILHRQFPDALIGHLTGDNFNALLKKENIFEEVNIACDHVNSYIHEPGIQMKAGIFRPKALTNYAADFDFDALVHLFDCAKIACDTIRTDGIRSFAVYTDEMGSAAEMRIYILNNFERAMRDKDIKVYFQPQVRTLSNKICGFEALARWEDREKGPLSPATFVPVLENAKLVAQLDAYILDRTAELLRSRLDAGMPVVPIAVNLSRQDFDLTDPMETFEYALLKYDIPPRLLRAEITETAMAWNRSNLKRIIRQFHRRGIQVCLDDFGSEYSSLNTLHNYHFDELKIDLEFFRNFDENSKKIIRSVAMMAEALDMHTLAEGVETEEQLSFLRQIGCGKIQSWAFSRPLPFDECVKNLEKKHIYFETDTEAQLYDAAGKVTVVTNTPTAIFEYRNDQIRILFGNEAFNKQLETTGTRDIEAANNAIANVFKIDPDLDRNLHNFLRNVYHSEQDDNALLYVYRGNDIRLQARRIAGTENFWLGVAEIQNITLLNTINRIKTRNFQNLHEQIRNSQTYETSESAAAASESMRSIEK